MASDDHDLSLRELIELMAQVQGKSAHLLPVPVGLMKLVATVLGKKSYADRLFGNLHVALRKRSVYCNGFRRIHFLRHIPENDFFYDHNFLFF